MFQPESGRSVAVHPLRPAGRGDEPAATELSEHLDTLLGEQLLPLRIRRDGTDDPYLLAVDASGQPVVVEVVGLLDAGAVVAALRRVGRAARMSTQDLARAYTGGPDRFPVHLAAFRQTVPATSLLGTTARAGARLILVCSAIHEDVDEVVEFLLQPGWPVDVLQVGVIPGADGARIVDVSPLSRTPPPRRAMEPTALRLVRSGELHLIGSPAGPRVTASSAASPTTPVPIVPGPITPRTSAPPTRQPGDRPALVRRVPVLKAPPFAVRVGPSGAPDASGAGQSAEPDAHRMSHPDPTPGPLPGAPYAFTGYVPSRVAPDDRLASVARHVGAPAALVWFRARRGERFEALLHGDGRIELPDGASFTDPSAAAEAAIGAETPVDGWRVWHLDSPTGPSLGELALLAHRAGAHDQP